MITVKFDLIDPITYHTPDYDADIRLDAYGTVNAEQNGVGVERQITDAVAAAFVPIFAEFGRTVNYSDLPLRLPELSKALSDRLTDMLNYPCSAVVEGIFPTEDSKALINKLQFAKMMGKPIQPPPAAAPAPAPTAPTAPAAPPPPVETAAPPPPAPEIPVVSPEPASPARPKFCGECGGSLAGAQNFCPYCGTKI
ncbi:MAG: hypothetical protein IJT87_06570 [Ruminiclostridium sp.]|nr:hypothetical protein [Ruminiclostridium sp.]